ncbi:hypothetical protein EDEG_00543 [Edhazardia aedis USNM 41457]|uniref:Uncharacterized protein n=1 Tax=Edhazardia aedis (strain USNM 41457) TaxID=1003232 RepID=J8ZNI3_EDHAE|nr:hypothetical protein EDEG_00543 [Edhazardia aedis USNM 41457]|eukprot:EJW01243.1 hypothetical protein EDEG_00543 [Edhazardia aedis USNM 41457]
MISKTVYFYIYQQRKVFIMECFSRLPVYITIINIKKLLFHFEKEYKYHMIVFIVLNRQKAKISFLSHFKLLIITKKYIIFFLFKIRKIYHIITYNRIFHMITLYFVSKTK